MSTESEPNRPTADAPPRRSPLTRRLVLEAALELVDRDGLEELSMRKLASRLGVEAMSLYKHVANKDDLLEGLADLVWEEIASAAPPDDDWEAWLRAFGHALRDAVHRHARALPVIVGGEVCRVPGLELFADQLERIGAGGLDEDGMANAIRAIGQFALGSAVIELSCFGLAPDRGNETERHRLIRISRALPPDTPDRLVDAAFAVCDCDSQRVFEDGLDLMVRGCLQGR